MKQHIRNLRSKTNRTISLVLAAMSVVILSPATIVSALPQSQKDLFQDGVYYYDYNQSQVCSAVGVPADKNAGSNADHAGNPILNEQQFAAIAENQPAYQQAADQVGVPWPMLAAVHLMESNLARANPGKNLEGYYDGVYQFRTGAHAGDASGSKYPPGAVTQEEFLQQTIHAAEFLKSKATANSANNRELTTDASPDAVKDTFFGYNGRAPQYYDQAERLGYTREQGYEGSVYVMNMADAARDPSMSNSWKMFNGSTPSSTRPGAFLIYSAIAGISIDNNCSNAINGTVRQKVVALAKQELDLWTEGQLKPGDYTKYTGGIHANWCAFFASWIYNQAGYPIHESTKDGRLGAVQQIWDIGQEGGRFNYHSVDSGYTPKPGDMVIQKNNASHVNIVIAIEGDTITVIGGNQGGSGDMNGYYTRSAVTQYEMSINHANNTGFVSPD